MAMMLAAADLGIGSCHAGVADVEKAAALVTTVFLQGTQSRGSVVTPPTVRE